MSVKVYPSDVSSFVMVRPSVISAHYAIITAALAEGITKIDNIVYSEDVKYVLGAINKIGAGYIISDDALFVSGIGRNRESRYDTAVIDCGYSDEIFKFMLPVATYFFSEVEFILRGNLRNDSFTVFEKIFREKGLRFEMTSNGILTGGCPGGGSYDLSWTDDYKSICGLLLAAVLHDDYTEIEIADTEYVRRHVYNLIMCQKLLGISVSTPAENLVDADGNQYYESQDITIDDEILLSSYFMIAGALTSGIDIVGIREDELDSEGKALTEILHKAEIRLEYSGNALRVYPSRTCRFSVELNEYPELVPVICLLAVYTPGFSVIKGVGKLSEKLKNLIYELRSADVRIGYSEGQIVIEGAHIQRSSVFSAHNDPDLAMFFATYALLSDGVCTIENAECVNRIYPDFLHHLRCVGVRVDESDSDIL